MHHGDHDPEHTLAAVRTLQRPPIRQQTLVHASQARTFGIFATRIHTWWPVGQFSAGRERIRDVVTEPFVGGRVYERWNDDTEVDWATVSVWDPHDRLTLTWHLTPAATRVDLTFGVVAPRLTSVRLEHSGWESLTDEQLGTDCALPGGYLGGSFERGWRRILAAFGAHLDALDNAEVTP